MPPDILEGKVLDRPKNRIRRLVRRFRARCLACQAELICPDADDPWGWMNSDQVASFIADHRTRCGNPHVVGVEVDEVEVD
jgi:hypothetical protein